MNELWPCDQCGWWVTLGEPDPCIGYLPNVAYACCGHGDTEDAYISFTHDNPGDDPPEHPVVRGEAALTWQAWLMLSNAVSNELDGS